MAKPLVELEGVVKTFRGSGGPVRALDGIGAHLPAGQVTGIVGPDGAGKTTLMRLMVGLLVPDEGRITVCGFNSGREATAIHAVVGYMPQRFGLYEDLTVAENMALHADLRGLGKAERPDVFSRLLSFTGLGPFQSRLAGALSGGMKQKLGLACTLLARPRLLLLDEPSVGVDPLSRRELWQMVYELVDEGIGVAWSTAYLDEAERCRSVLLLNEGRLLYAGAPEGLTRRVEGRTFAVRRIGADKRAAQKRASAAPGVLDALIQGRNLRLVMAPDRPPPEASSLAREALVVPVRPRFEDAFVSLLRHDRPAEGAELETVPPAAAGEGVMVEARDLSRTFGSFRAVDRVSFTVGRGEIFGLLGPNGAGKSTTFKMLCGLLPPSDGIARVAGFDLRRARAEARSRLGYMSQRFSLYESLSVRQNLTFFSGVYGLSGPERQDAITQALEISGLESAADTDAGDLPLGMKQRLALASALMHRPSVLFLDEPTSGVDPLTRRDFWGRINAMAGAGVTILVTTHFLDEAEYCDRIGIIFQGQLIAIGAPDELKAKMQTPDMPDPSLEDAFIRLIEARGERSAA
jgi:ABC-2 type transport system ATP-binding protein